MRKGVPGNASFAHAKEMDLMHISQATHVRFLPRACGVQRKEFDSSLSSKKGIYTDKQKIIYDAFLKLFQFAPSIFKQALFLHDHRQH